MYKLLTTVAIVAISASSVSANEWTGGQGLVQDLETIYQNLDGQDHFDTLQGNTGELNLFFNEVDKGVTHVTLSVDAVTHEIKPAVVGGSSFTDIETRANNLVNRINYDLFVETADTTYDVDGAYAVAQNSFGGDPSDTGNNDIINNQTAGLVGVKVTEVVSNVNTFNDGLLSSTLTEEQRKAFTDEFAVAGTGNDNFNGITISGFNTTLGELNTAITTATDTNGAFFGNTGLAGFTNTTVNNYVIPSYNSFEDIGNAGAGGFGSISDWANGVQTVNVDPGDTDAEFTFAGTETLTVVSPTVVNVAGVDVTIADDVRFTAK